MPDILFYHLLSHPLERILPELLEKSVIKGWRAVISSPEPARLEMLDRHLWVYRDDSFLPHGIAGKPFEADQPILLVSRDVFINQPDIAFLIDQAILPDPSRLQRICIIFDGHDEQGVDMARAQWKEITDLELPGTYWRQNESGRWEKQAENKFSKTA